MYLYVLVRDIVNCFSLLNIVTYWSMNLGKVLLYVLNLFFYSMRLRQVVSLTIRLQFSNKGDN